MTKRVVIIGAGPGGLAAALLLAQGGADVQVLERLPWVGGRTSALEAEGFRFDRGPTFFLYPRILEEIFAATGHDLHQEIALLRLDPQYRLVFGAGGDILATPDVDRMARAIAALCPADARSFPRFLAENRHKLTHFRPCLERPFLSWRALLSPQLLRLLPLLRPWRSLDQDLATYFSDPRVRLAFSFQAKYLGMSPFNCPSLFSILSFLEYEYGVFHPVGGCAAVTDAMARIARNMGVQFALHTEVKEIVFAGRRAVGVRTAQQHYPADAVVVNGDFARVISRLVPNHLRRRWSDQRIARKRYSCSTFMLYLGLAGRYDHLPHHTIYMAREYAHNLADIEQRHVLSGDPSLYVQNASVTDPSLAPAGMSTLYVLIPVTHQHANIDWKQERQRYRALAMQQLAKVGFTDVERRIRFEHIVTPDDWEAQHDIYRGATFSLAHNLRQMLHWRPHNRFEEVEGVYLVGGGTHPGSGLPVIFESARISTTLLLADLGIATGVQRPPAGAGVQQASQAWAQYTGVS